MTSPADYPVAIPILTDALVAKIHFANEEAGRKEQAFNTSFRHSDAGGCARKLAYSMLGLEQTNPPDLAGEWVMWLGTLIHEKLQEALHDRFGSSCEVETKLRHDDLSSGHIDAVIDRVPGIGRIAYELKTKGGYGFDKAIGVNRKAYRQEIPEGPGTGAKIQGALNAAAVDADLLVIGVVGMEAISKQFAERIGFDDLSRIIAEWHYTKAEYGPWAKSELERMQAIEMSVNAEVRPGRYAIGDEFENVWLDPNDLRPNWRCTYCPQLDRCKADS